MKHLVNAIGKERQHFSELRKAERPFLKEEFVKFAAENHLKYSLIESGDDFLVSTFFVDDLIRDYKRKFNVQ